jgi:hypothetical protein
MHVVFVVHRGCLGDAWEMPELRGFKKLNFKKSCSRSAKSLLSCQVFLLGCS